jgi:outer membrane protein
MNFVLLILVGVLFYLHFSGPSAKSSHTTSKAVDSSVSGPFKIAYFEMDSVENNYSYLKDVRTQLKAKEQELTGQMNQLKSRYMDKVNKYKQEAQTMTQERQSSIEQELMGEQKMLSNKEQSIGLELQDASFKKMQDVNKRIEDFLKDYNKDKGYSYILTHQPGLIYYKDPQYDITADVLKGLNENYKKKD